MNSGGALTIGYPPELNEILLNQMKISVEIRGFIGHISLSQTINAVKNIILDWAIDLEKAGVTGSGLGFSNSDRKEAKNVTQNIYAQNIGNLGDISRNSSFSSNISSGSFSIEKIETAKKKINDCIPALPRDIQDQVSNHIAAIPAGDTASDRALAEKSFRAILRVCENATGNIAAEGITALIRSLF